MGATPRHRGNRSTGSKSLSRAVGWRDQHAVSARRTRKIRRSSRRSRKDEIPSRRKPGRPVARERILHWFGAKVAALRQQRGWTQRELSRRSGLPRSYLAQVETGRRNPAFKTIARLAAAFGLTLVDLLTDLPPGRH